MKKFAFLFLAACAAFSPAVRAQWQDETFVLKPGWNAVYLHIDPSYDLLNNLITGTNNKISEIWMWNTPASPDRFLVNPQTPAEGFDWLHWVRNPAVTNTMQRLIGNTAYLVRNTNNVDYSWTLRGKPVPPKYNWTSKGVNLIGFSTPSNGPIFANFLIPMQDLMTGGEFFRYSDGNNDLSPTKFNGLFNFVRVQRGEAYWVKWADHFNTYFGAFDLSLQNASGVHFSADLSEYTIKIENRLKTQSTITIALRDSLTPPAGMAPILGKPPLLRRGELNVTNLTYTHTNFNTAQTVVLAPAGQPGSAAEVVLGLNRSAMTGAPGSLYAGVLRLTDAAGFSQVDLPVTALVASKAGLWVGEASVTHVQHYIKNYERAPNGKPLLGTNGLAYAVTNINTSFGPAARAFPLRLIIHSGTNGETRLLQRVYSGIDHGSNNVLAIRENILHPDFLAQARRISSTHLPFSDGNTGWEFVGNFAAGATVTTRVTVPYGDQASNPFLHTYHPDHDNRNATFDQTLARGQESYDVVRDIALEILPLPSDFGSLTAAGSQMIGNYAESLTFKGSGTEQRVIYTAGTFKLNRISTIESLKTAP